MDVEVPLAITPPRAPWCDARPFAPYTPVDYRPRAPDEWAAPRSHSCGTACFAPGAAACTEPPRGVAIYVELEQPGSRVPRRRSPSRPEEKPRKAHAHAHERPAPAPTSPTPSPKHEPKTQASFKLEPHPPPRPSTKRARPQADVDGPNTASLPSKKRRLRLELITSRLSRPFSLPATHILNREARAAGDRRFARAHAEGRRGAAEVRRFAVLNRARCAGGTSWSEMGVLLQRQAPAGRTSSPLPAPVRVPMGSPLSPPRQPLPLPARQIPKSTPSPPPQCRSPHEDDDDCEAFPGTLYGECDDPEDVYSDFGAIFDAGAGDEGEEGRCFEEYLDELDGISWAAR